MAPAHAARELNLRGSRSTGSTGTSISSAVPTAVDVSFGRCSRIDARLRRSGLSDLLLRDQTKREVIDLPAVLNEAALGRYLM